MNIFCFEFCSPWRLCIRLSEGKVDGRNRVRTQFCLCACFMLTAKGHNGHYFLVREWVFGPCKRFSWKSFPERKRTEPPLQYYFITCWKILHKKREKAQRYQTSLPLLHKEMTTAHVKTILYSRQHEKTCCPKLLTNQIHLSSTLSSRGTKLAPPHRNSIHRRIGAAMNQHLKIIQPNTLLKQFPREGQPGKCPGEF